MNGGKKMKKKMVSVLLSAAMVMSLLAGCGSTGAAAEETGAPAQDAPKEEAKQEAEEEKETAAGIGEEPITITILAGQSTTDAGTEDMITEAVAAVYPNITLEWECVGWNDLAPKMQQYVQSGLPDIIIGKGQDVATYAPLGVLGDIT